MERETLTPQSGGERTTQSDITRMSDEEKRIRIAELCGAKKDELGNWRKDGKVVASHVVHFPDYLNDLNAMAEAEAQLLDGDNIDTRSLYYDYLSLSGHLDDSWDRDRATFEMDWNVLRATARQRADAFLLTLSGSTNPKRSSSTASGVSEE